jgi:hypothetical protein
MARKFNVRLNGERAEVVFPERCVCCGEAKETQSILKASRLVTAKRGKQVQKTVELVVPHCRRCQRAGERSDKISLISLLAGTVLGCVVFFLPVMLGFDWLEDVLGVTLSADAVSAQTTLIFLLPVLLGSLVGFGAEAMVKVVMIPFAGKAHLYAPLYLLQFITNAEYTAGLAASPAADFKSLKLTIYNADIAREFARLNPAAAKPV